MASGSGNGGTGRKPGTEMSPEARDRLAFEPDVVPSEDDEAFWEAQRLAEDPASLQRWFHEDRRAALELVIKARNPALVPTLVDVLQDEAITHFYIAEALEQISDEPDRTVAIEIKRSEEAQVDSFPPRTGTSAAEDDKILDHIQSRELREAFRINRARAAELIVEDAKSDPIPRHIHAINLPPLLRDQARVQLFMALALARYPQQRSRVLKIIFAEAVQLTAEPETLCFTLHSLESFEDLIVDQLAADASDAARRGRDLTLRFFVAFLGGAALEEQEALTVAGIVLRCTGSLGDGLDAVIGRMAELSNVSVEEMGLRVCARVLARPAEFDARELATAAGWLRRHLSGEHAAIPPSPFVSPSSAAPTSEGSVESPRAPILHNLTDDRSPRQTSPVSPMDAAQGESTATPTPELDLSSLQPTTNYDTGLSPEQERFMERLAALYAIAVEIRLGRAKPEDLDDAMAALNQAHRGLDTARVLGAHEAAKILGVTRGHVWHMADEGEIGRKIDNDDYRFSRRELEVHRNRKRNKGGRPRKPLD